LLFINSNYIQNIYKLTIHTIIELFPEFHHAIRLNRSRDLVDIRGEGHIYVAKR